MPKLIKENITQIKESNMSTIIEKNITTKIKDYFEDSKFLDESKKSKFTLINEIHRELGWGNLSTSFFAFMCHLVGYMTPKAAKIAKALRVHKVDTYHFLSTKIHAAHQTIPSNSSDEQIERVKQDLLNYAKSNLPQFSLEEVEYIYDNIHKCDIVIEKLEIADFKTKNVSWKEISTAMHKNAENKKCKVPVACKIQVNRKSNQKQQTKTEHDVALEMQNKIKQINTLHSSLVFASKAHSLLQESNILKVAFKQIEILKKEYIKLAESISVESSTAEKNLATLLKLDIKEKMSFRVNQIEKALHEPDLYGNTHSQLQLASIEEYQAEYVQFASLIGVDLHQAKEDLKNEINNAQMLAKKTKTEPL